MNEEQSKQPVRIRMDSFKRQRAAGRVGRIDNFVRQDKTENSGAAEEPSANAANMENTANTANINPPNEKEENKNSAWLKIGKLPLYLLIFLLPLFFLPLTIAPVEMGKQILASVLVLISFACYLANSIETRKIIYHKSLLGLSVLFLLLVLAASAVFSQSVSASVFGNFIQPDSLFNFFIYGLVFYLTGIFFGKKDFRKIGILFLASLVLTTVFGLLQLFGYFVFPVFSNSLDFTKQTGFNFLGSVLNWGIFIAFGLALIISALVNFRLSLAGRIILLIAALPIIAGLVIINHYLLWVALAFAALILMAYCFTSSKKINIPLAMMIISLFFALISSSLPALVETPVYIRPSLSSTLDIAKGTLWFKADQPWSASVKNILLGSGPSTFTYDYALYRSKDLNQTNFWQVRFDQGFSFMATLLATAGILGALAVLFLFFSFVRQTLKNIESKEVITSALGILFLIIMLVFCPSFIVQFIFVFLGLGLLAQDSSRREISLVSASKPRAFLAFIALVLLLVGNLFVFYSVSKKYAAAVYYERGLSAYNKDGNLIKCLSDLDKAVLFDPDSDQYLRVLSQAFLLDVGDLLRKNADDSSQSEANSARIQNEISIAVQIARKAASINPADSSNWSNLASVYENIMLLTSGAEKFAADNYKRAIQSDPQNPAGYVDLARVLLSTADYNKEKDKNLWQESLDEARSSLEKSLELKADYATPRFMMALIYAREGKTQDAIDKMEETKLFAPRDAGLVFQLGVLYYNDNQLDKAKAEFERVVALNSDYSNARYFLGLIYDKLGKKQMAIEQFEKIAESNPDNEEVGKILKNLKKGGSALEGIVSLPEEKADIPLSSEKQEKEINDLNPEINNPAPPLPEGAGAAQPSAENSAKDEEKLEIGN